MTNNAARLCQMHFPAYGEKLMKSAIVRAAQLATAAIVTTLALTAGGTAALAAPAGRAGGDPVVDTATPRASVPAKSSVLASGDGVWNTGEIAYNRDSAYGSYIFDTTLSSIYTFVSYNFVNTNVNLNDQASSIRNAQNAYHYSYEHAGYAGAFVTILPYGQCNSVTCYAYTSLGWANDVLSSQS
jgi:hypothetical protein